MISRVTVQVLLVLQAFLREPGGELYGLALIRQTGLLAGTAYPILQRLEEAGLAVSRWEAAGPHGRPARHYYRLTADGAEQAREIVASGRRPARTALRDLARNLAPGLNSDCGLSRD